MKIRIYYIIVRLINSWPSKIIGPILRKILNKRAKLNVVSIDKLSKDISLGLFILATPEIHKSNDWYGHANALKKYAGADPNYHIKGLIEHGIFFGNYIWTQDHDSNLPIALTFSQKRKDVIEKNSNKKAFAIGPYIHYAKDYLEEEEFNLELKRLGSNLLVFPAHSTSASLTSYEVVDFISQIKKIAKEYRTIRVCLYWRDILLGRHKPYQKAGFECVSAGHIFDPFFLPRLKTIISLATSTMTNTIGTYTGYSIYLNKPHYFYKQELKVIGDKRELENISIKEVLNDLKPLQEAFSSFRKSISSKQFEITKLYFGLDQVKSAGELKKIFKIGEKLYKS